MSVRGASHGEEPAGDCGERFFAVRARSRGGLRVRPPDGGSRELTLCLGGSEQGEAFSGVRESEPGEALSCSPVSE